MTGVIHIEKHDCKVSLATVDTYCGMTLRIDYEGVTSPEGHDFVAPSWLNEDRPLSTITCPKCRELVSDKKNFNLTDAQKATLQMMQERLAGATLDYYGPGSAHSPRVCRLGCLRGVLEMNNYMMNFPYGAKVFDDTTMEGSGGGLLVNGELTNDKTLYDMYYELCNASEVPSEHPGFHEFLYNLGFTHYRAFKDYDVVPVTFMIIWLDPDWSWCWEGKKAVFYGPILPDDQYGKFGRGSFAPLGCMTDDAAKNALIQKGLKGQLRDTDDGIIEIEVTHK